MTEPNGFEERVVLPTVAKAKGVVTIELMNSEGVVVEKQKSTNFIAKGMDYYNFLSMLTAFRDKLPTLPLYQLLLTTAAHDPEPAAEWAVRGELIGYARPGQTYSGTSEFMGSANLSESINTGTMRRIVLDFPSNAANGMIDSVYFSTRAIVPTELYSSASTAAPNQPLLVGMIGAPGVKRLVHPDDTEVSNRVMAVTYYDSKYYVLMCRTTGSTTAQSYRGNLLRVFDDSGVFEQEVTLKAINGYTSDMYTDMTAYDNKLYLTGEHAGNPGIHTIPLNDLEAIPTRALYVLSTHGIVYDPKSNNFFTRSGDDSGGTVGSVNRYTVGFQLLETIPLRIPGSTSIPRYNLVGDPWYRNIVGRRLNIHNGQLYDCLHTINLDNGSVIDRGGNLFLTGIINNQMVDHQGTVHPMHGFTTRFRLPSTVTKTDQVTMKVTYDFIFPSIYTA